MEQELEAINKIACELLAASQSAWSWRHLHTSFLLARVRSHSIFGPCLAPSRPAFRVASGRCGEGGTLAGETTNMKAQEQGGN